MKIGISIGALQSLYGDERAIEIAKEIGADAVDFDLSGIQFDCDNPDSVYSKSDDEITEYFTSLKNKARALGIEISQTHGRVTSFINDAEHDENVVKNAYRDCLATKALGAPVCVMHGVTTIFFTPDTDPEFMHNLNFEFFKVALNFAKKFGIKIATETFGDAPNLGCCDFFGNTKEFIKAYNKITSYDDFKDYLVVCMDTGHSNKAMRFNNNPTPADAIRKIGKSIKVLHLHDNDTLTDQHRIPFTGTIDWDDVFDALDEIGYDGVYNLELNLACFGKGIEIETARYGIEVLRNYLKNRGE